MTNLLCLIGFHRYEKCYIKLRMGCMWVPTWKYKCVCCGKYLVDMRDCV